MLQSRCRSAFARQVQLTVGCAAKTGWIAVAVKHNSFIAQHPPHFGFGVRQIPEADQIGVTIAIVIVHQEIVHRSHLHRTGKGL